MNNPLSTFDRFLTQKLTNFCWWSDIKFGKNNVWWAKVTLAVFFPIIAMALNLLYDPSYELAGSSITFWYDLFTVYLFAWLLSYLCVSVFPVTKTFLRNAETSPNKNREFLIVTSIKVSAFLDLLLLITFPSIFTFGLDPAQRSTGEAIALVLSFQLILYLLCTEPIPPAVKRKRLEEIENKRLQCIPQKN